MASRLFPSLFLPFHTLCLIKNASLSVLCDLSLRDTPFFQSSLAGRFRRFSPSPWRGQGLKAFSPRPPLFFQTHLLSKADKDQPPNLDDGYSFFFSPYPFFLVLFAVPYFFFVSSNFIRPWFPSIPPARKHALTIVVLPVQKGIGYSSSPPSFPHFHFPRKTFVLENRLSSRRL